MHSIVSKSNIGDQISREYSKFKIADILCKVISDGCEKHDSFTASLAMKCIVGIVSVINEHKSLVKMFTPLMNFNEVISSVASTYFSRFPMDVAIILSDVSLHITKIFDLKGRKIKPVWKLVNDVAKLNSDNNPDLFDCITYDLISLPCHVPNINTPLNFDKTFKWILTRGTNMFTREKISGYEFLEYNLGSGLPLNTAYLDGRWGK